MYGNVKEKPMEWLVTFGESSGHKFLRILFAILAVITFLGYFALGGLSFMVIFAIFAGIFAWFQTHANKEYEYCFFDDELEITAVYNKSSRSKKNICINMKEVDYMVKRVETVDVVKCFCKGDNISAIYSLVVPKDGKRTAYVIEAIPEFVKYMETKRKLR